jgi:peptide chain release factor 1
MMDLSVALKKLDDVEFRYERLNDEMATPEVYLHADKMKTIALERAEIEQTVVTYQEYRSVVKSIEENEELRGDADLGDLAAEELARLIPRRDQLVQELMTFLVPVDPLDKKDIFLEIRAGTGGEEAALFAANLFRMYCRYAENRRWVVEIMSISETELGGLREVIAQIRGARVYSYLKFEGGVHRVQRVPETESQGRIHTSAVTVAVMPEADDNAEEQIDKNDIREDIYRASGAGGQHINKTDSAIRLTHLPTNIVVTCQDERSQHKNRAKAYKVLAARLAEKRRSEQDAEEQDARRAMVGSGDRSERIRTYNFPQNRLTDHRINLTLYKLEQIMEGDLNEMISNLQAQFAAIALAER